MKKINLKAFVEGRKISETARLLGCTAPAITKALESDREIYITELPNGTFEGKEIKDFPSPHHTKKSHAA